jgi:hypothetical protein
LGIFKVFRAFTEKCRCFGTGIPVTGLPISGSCLLIVPAVFLEGDLGERQQPESDTE